MSKIEIIIAVASGVVTIASIVYNIIQMIQKKNIRKYLKASMHSNYNKFYQICRLCTRANEDGVRDNPEKLQGLFKYINGIADSARTGILSFSQHTIDFKPEYEHPAFPGEKLNNKVKLGVPPDTLVDDENLFMK